MEQLYVYILSAIALLVVAGIPLIISSIRISGKLEFNEMEISSKPELDQIFFRTIDRFAGTHGYARGLDLSIGGLSGENFSRVYFHSDGSALMAVQMFSENRESEKYLEFTTIYQEMEMTTNNSQVASVLPAPPWGRVFHRPDIQDPEALMRLHRKNCASHGRGSIRRLVKEEFGKEFQKSHSRVLEHQASIGLLRHHSGDDTYSPTMKLALTGVANFLNPLKDNFTWRRFFAGYLSSVAFTAAGWYVLLFCALCGYGIERERELSLAVLALSYCAAGGIIGYYFTGKNFIWSILAAAPQLAVLSYLEIAPLAFAEFSFLLLTYLCLRSASLMYEYANKPESRGRTALKALELPLVAAMFVYLAGGFL